MFVDNFIWQNLSFKEYALWSQAPLVGQLLVKMVLANKLDGICGLNTKPLSIYTSEGFFCISHLPIFGETKSELSVMATMRYVVANLHLPMSTPTRHKSPQLLKLIFYRTENCSKIP